MTRKLERIPARRCANPECRVLFTPDREDQIYHSSACRESWYKKKYYGQTSYNRICPQCKTSFTTTKSKQIYCSPECRQEINRGICVICERGGRMYTHKGLKLCARCYYMAKGIDEGYAEIYLKAVGNVS